jgi:hypothetical protein
MIYKTCTAAPLMLWALWLRQAPAVAQSLPREASTEGQRPLSAPLPPAFIGIRPKDSCALSRLKNVGRGGLGGSGRFAAPAIHAVLCIIAYVPLCETLGGGEQPFPFLSYSLRAAAAASTPIPSLDLRAGILSASAYAAVSEAQTLQSVSRLPASYLRGVCVSLGDFRAFAWEVIESSQVPYTVLGYRS